MAYKGQYDTIITIGAVVGGIYLLQKSNFFGEIGQGIGGIGRGVGDIGTGTGIGMAGLGTGLGGGLYGIGAGVQGLGTGLGSGLGGLGIGTGMGLYEIGSGFHDIGYGAGSLFNKAGDIFTGFASMESSFGYGINNLLTELGAISAKLNTAWGSFTLGTSAPQTTVGQVFVQSSMKPTGTLPDTTFLNGGNKTAGTAKGRVTSIPMTTRSNPTPAATKNPLRNPIPVPKLPIWLK